VYGREVDVYGREVDVYGREVDVYGREVDVYGREVDVYGHEGEGVLVMAEFNGCTYDISHFRSTSLFVS
jgi:hypothetical protein